ncbi:hypothetical protein [Phytopseudomonas seleniipraecipitans]
MIGAGAGAAIGTLGGKMMSEQLNKFIPGSVGELGGVLQAQCFPK